MNKEDLIDRFLVYNRLTLLEGFCLMFISYAYGIMISTAYTEIREMSLIGVLFGLGMFYVLYVKKVRA